MASYLKSLSPVPGFPDYTGPHKVGTIDVEIPVIELDAPSPPPDESIDTVQFRIFYPCEVEPKTSKQINWLPSPQRAHVAAYTKFLGAGSTLAEVIAWVSFLTFFCFRVVIRADLLHRFFPRLLYYITIPARKNAPVLEPAAKRWPVMIFSHGLGGSRNAYSHLAGSVASHGVIVIAPEHRDGSAPISYIREVPMAKDNGEKSSVAKTRRVVPYTKISHTPSPEVDAARTAQLKIRLWELGCVHDALLKIDEGVKLTNLNNSSAHFLPNFNGKMEVHEPGKITFAGHSFGAATVAQFVKSTFYSAETSNAPASYEPVFTPTSRSAITGQITPNTPVILLDIWCMPLRSKSTRWLWNKPFPCYAPGGPGGCALLAIESQAFFNWKVHLKTTQRLLSPNPASDAQTIKDDGRPGPHFYYPTASAHLSQSDFGVLFPWFTKKIFAIEEPERIMKLNVRAILKLLRERHIPVSPTSAADMELGSEADMVTKDDQKIFSTDGAIRGWNYLTIDVNDPAVTDLEGDSGVSIKAEPAQAVVGGELMKQTQGTAESLLSPNLSPENVQWAA